MTHNFVLLRKFENPVTCFVCNKGIYDLSETVFTCKDCPTPSYVHMKCKTLAKNHECRSIPQTIKKIPCADEPPKFFKILLPKEVKLVKYNPNSILSNVLEQLDQEKKFFDYVAYDAKGTEIKNLDIPLSSVIPTIYYLPNGEPLRNHIRLISNIIRLREEIDNSDKNKKTPLFPANNADINKSPNKEKDPKCQRRKSVPDNSNRPKEINSNGIIAKHGGGIITIKTIYGQDLANTSEKYKYLYYTIHSNFKQRFRSPTIGNTPNPKWDYVIKFNSKSESDIFTIKVWATKSDFSEDKMLLIGECSVNLNCSMDNRLHVKLKKEPKKYKEIKKSGTLLILWEYTKQKQKTHDRSTTRISKEKITDHFVLGKKIGKGAFSKVLEATKKETSEKVAVKILVNYRNLENAEDDEEAFRREIKILSLLNHRNIVKLHQVFEDKNYYYVVMEIVSGGDLLDNGIITEMEAAFLLSQILDALVYLEKFKICHRDIKPENLRFADPDRTILKLIDFGEAKSCAQGGLKDYCGTPDYMAPEVLDPKGLPYDCRVDVWAVGCICFLMLSGKTPFDGNTEDEIFKNILEFKYSFSLPVWENVSDGAKDFIRCCLKPIGQRFYASDAKKHEWIQTNSRSIGKVTKRNNRSISHERPLKNNNDKYSKSATSSPSITPISSPHLPRKSRDRSPRKEAPENQKSNNYSSFFKKLARYPNRSVSPSPVRPNNQTTNDRSVIISSSSETNIPSFNKKSSNPQIDIDHNNNKSDKITNRKRSPSSPPRPNTVSERSIPKISPLTPTKYKSERNIYRKPESPLKDTKSARSSEKLTLSQIISLLTPQQDNSSTKETTLSQDTTPRPVNTPKQDPTPRENFTENFKGDIFPDNPSKGEQSLQDYMSQESTQRDIISLDTNQQEIIPEITNKGETIKRVNIPEEKIGEIIPEENTKSNLIPEENSQETPLGENISQEIRLNLSVETIQRENFTIYSTKAENMSLGSTQGNIPEETLQEEFPVKEIHNQEEKSQETPQGEITQQENIPEKEITQQEVILC